MLVPAEQVFGPDQKIGIKLTPEGTIVVPEDTPCPECPQECVVAFSGWLFMGRSSTNAHPSGYHTAVQHPDVTFSKVGGSTTTWSILAIPILNACGGTLTLTFDDNGITNTYDVTTFPTDLPGPDYAPGHAGMDLTGTSNSGTMFIRAQLNDVDIGWPFELNTTITPPA
ncbi:MAG: hypothetical protein ABI831_06850 [Betaproteobacteria bacterium]